MSSPKLVLITPEASGDEILRGAREALQDGVGSRAYAHAGVALQLRAKQLSPEERAELGVALRELTRAAGVALIVNGDLELAARLEAEGVQLPERGPSVAEARVRLGSGPSIGVSRHDAQGVLRSLDEGASYVVLGPVHDVPGKGAALGLAGFGRIAAASPLPVLALGGITLARVAPVLAAGAHGIAVIREVFSAQRPAHALAELLRALGDAAEA